MLKLMRADIYRIIRGKTLYVTFAVLLIFNFLLGVSWQMVYDGTAEVHESADVSAATTAIVSETGVTGIQMPGLLASSMESFVFFLLPIIVITAAAIFSDNTVKNDLAWGVSRTKLYLAKLLVASALGLLMLLLYMGTGMLIGTLAGGFGGPAPAGHWVNLLQVLSAQLFMLIAVTAFGVFLVFTTKRTAAVNGVYIAFILVPSLIIQLLMMSNPNFSRLLDFDLPTNINRLANLRWLETYEILRALGIGAFYLLASTIGGIALFRKAEIK